MANKWVYLFTEGNATMRNLLGGKGANLAEMTNLGLPVPQGFTITTEACTQYYEDGEKINDEIMGQIMDHINKMEEITGKKFGDKENPLLVSVRSGARASMPGMMDTILNLGLNEEVVEVLAAKSGNPRWAYDCYRRFIQMFSDVVMEVGKKYYSADGVHFEGFKLENPFLFKDLTETTNYSAEDLDKVFSLLNIDNSLLENKGATFKEAEEHYHINALYLLAHSALESDWGRSKIAKDKNNFFGITAYDTTPYLSAKTFDDVDKGILGASKWIKENYIDRGRTFLGNKASGMNVEYASDPYWGEKIASVMMKINEKLGGKD